MYRPGKQGQKPDYLTRRSQDLPKGIEDARERQQFQTLLQDHQIHDDVKKALSAMWHLNTVEDEDRVSENDTSEALEEETVIDDGAPGSETQAVDDALATDGPPEAGMPPERSFEDLLSDAYENDRTVQDIIVAKERGVRKLPPHILTRGIKLSMGDLEVRDKSPMVLQPSIRP
jgi:hypothetical protein